MEKVLCVDSEETYSKQNVAVRFPVRLKIGVDLGSLSGE